MRPRLSIPLLALALLTGCDAARDDGTLGPLQNATADVGALQGAGEWALVAAVVGGRTYDFSDEGGRWTASFTAEGLVTGKISVNTYGGRYVATDGGAITVREVASTLILDSERAVRLSEVFLRTLHRAERFETNGRVLHVHTSDGGLRFVAAEAEPVG